MGYRRHVTLADDDADALFLLSRMMDRLYPGTSVATFTNPREALAHILDCGTDMLITNHSMGSMTGTDLIRALRSRRIEIPVLMISGSPEAREEALAAGADAFVAKSLSNRELETAIERLLPPAQE